MIRPINHLKLYFLHIVSSDEWPKFDKTLYHFLFSWLISYFCSSSGNFFCLNPLFCFFYFLRSFLLQMVLTHFPKKKHEEMAKKITFVLFEKRKKWEKPVKICTCWFQYFILWSSWYFIKIVQKQSKLQWDNIDIYLFVWMQFFILN